MMPGCKSGVFLGTVEDRSAVQQKAPFPYGFVEKMGFRILFLEENYPPS
jgi:hypothetical protein